MTSSGVARRHAVVLYVMLVLNAVGVSSLISLLAPAARLSHIPDALIVMAQALSAIAWTLVGGFWSRFADQTGHVRVILIGVLGAAVATALTGSAIWLGVNHVVAPMAALAALLIGRSVYGGVGLAAQPAAQAFVAARTTAKDRTATLAMLASAQGVGTVIGPAVAPLFTGLPILGLAGPLAVVSLLMLAMAPMLAVILPRDRRPPVAAARGAGKAGALWRLPELRRYMFYAWLIAFALTASLQTTGFLVLDTLGGAPSTAQPWVGRAITAGAVVTLIVQFGLIPRLSLSPRKLMILGPLIGIAGMMLLAIGHAYAMILAGVMIADAGFALARPGVSAAASLAVAPERQAEIAGALLSAFSLGIVVGPVAGVSLYTLWRPLPFMTIALLLAAAFIVTLRTRQPDQSVPLDDPLAEAPEATA